jgi:formylmethanofuran dehydrogenase subunit C
VIIPEGHEIIEREIIELQEKISEAREISSIPGYENILKNLNVELADLAESYFSMDPEKIRINKITIEGDFEYAGYWMKGGTLVVKGDVERAGRWMKGGNLVVNGDVDGAGWEMKGGNLVVNGDVKGYAGSQMKGGSLVVNGDVSNAGQKMKGGRIVVSGDVVYAGTEMKGGTLVVKGGVGYAGRWMKDGKIAIYGKVDRIYDIHGGNIYIDFDKNPSYKMDERIRPIEEFDGGLDDRH